MGDGSTILHYANPTVGQPLGSLFTVEWFPDGVRLTRPVPPAWSGAAVAFVVGWVAVLMVLGCAAELTDGLGRRHASEWAFLVLLLAALMAVAFVCFSVAWQSSGSRTLMVAVRGRELTIANGVLTLTGRPWRTRRARRFSVSIGQPELPTFRLVALLRVSVGFGMTRQLLYALPRDECVWAARLLNDVLASRHSS